jgi:hypothetical protein
MAASAAFFGSPLFLLSQMFQPKPAAHLGDLVEIKIAVCSLVMVPEESRLQPVGVCVMPLRSIVN